MPTGEDGEHEWVDRIGQIRAQWRAERPDIDTSPIEVLGRLHRDFQRYQSLSNRLFEQHGLNMASFDVLMALRRSGSPYSKSASELCEVSMLTSAAVTLRMDRLEKAGLITRERDSKDRRVVHSKLTPKGLAVVDAALDEHLRHESRMLAELTEDERVQLADLLRRLERSLQSAQQRLARLNATKAPQEST